MCRRSFDSGQMDNAKWRSPPETRTGANDGKQKQNDSGFFEGNVGGKSHSKERMNVNSRANILLVCDVFENEETSDGEKKGKPNPN